MARRSAQHHLRCPRRPDPPGDPRRGSREGEATVNELAEPFPISVQAVSKHLKVLERAGLITRGRTAQLRPSRLRAAPLKDAADWIELYRQFWSASFDRLDERLQASED